MGNSEARLKDLMVRGRAGDAAAYRAFLTDLSSHLRAFLRKRLSSLPDEVEDVLQETLLAVHNQRHTYGAGHPLTAWVHAIAKYKLIDFLRRHARDDGPTEPYDDAMELFSENALGAAEAHRDVSKLLLALPERQRLPIVYVKLEGLSVVEAAARTGMSVSAVKIGIHRGLKALAAQLRRTL